MAKVERFQDLIAWRKARVLTNDILAVAERPALSRSRVITDQLQRATISVMSNIAEGYERGTPAEFHQFLVIAKASCAEVRSLLCVLSDRGYISPDEYARLDAQAEEVSRVLGGLRAAVARQRDGGRSKEQRP